MEMRANQMNTDLGVDVFLIDRTLSSLPFYYKWQGTKAAGSLQTEAIGPKRMDLDMKEAELQRGSFYFNHESQE